MSAHEQPKPKPGQGWIARIVIVAVFAAAVLALWRVGVFDLLSFAALRERRAELTDFVSGHRVLALAAFTALYAVVTLLALPGASWLTIAGGFLFGLVGGGAATALGATAGATVLFLLARFVLGAPMRARAGPFLARFEAGFQRNAFSYLLSIRLIPAVPFFIANIAPALLGARTSTFVITTAVGILPGVIAYSWIGSGLGATMDAGRTPDLAGFATQLLPAFALLGLLSLAPVAFSLVRQRRTAQGQGDGAHE